MVLVIVAVIAGVAVVSLGALGKDPPAKTTAKRLSALLNMASEDAVMQGRELGLVIKPHSYRFLVYKNRQWQPLADDDLYRQREVDSAVKLSVRIEGRAVTLGDQDNGGRKPDVLLLSSGELTPFDLRLTSTDSRHAYRVVGSLDKGIRVLSPGGTTDELYPVSPHCTRSEPARSGAARRSPQAMARVLHQPWILGKDCNAALAYWAGSLRARQGAPHLSASRLAEHAQ